MGHSMSDATRLQEQVRNLLLQHSQQAGSSGNWALFRRLGELAERADALRADIQGAQAGAETPLPPREEPRTAPAASKGTTDYPRFGVRGGQLVKQGLQRNGRDTYEHAVPRDKCERILADLAPLAARPTRIFAMDDIASSRDLPRYMTYVVVSLLVRQGLVRQLRKGAYKFAAATDLTQEMAALWPKLEKVELD